MMRSRKKYLLALVVSLLTAPYSLPAAAEGAVRTFSCTLERACDATGACVAESGDVEFRMEPRQLDDNGAGAYQLAYADQKVAMQAVSDAGPFTWSTANERHTLLVNAETRLLWHRLSLTPSLQASSHYMRCTLRQ